MPPDSAADAPPPGASAEPPPAPEADPVGPRVTGWEALDRWVKPAPAAPAGAPGTPPEAVPDARPRRRLFRRKPREETPVAGAPPEPAAAEVAAVAVAPGPPAEAPPAETAPAPPSKPERPGVLRRRRRDLEGRLEQGLFDLGGLTLELHGRHLLTEDVLRRRAAEMNDLEEQIHDVDRQLDEMRDERRVTREGGRGAQRCPVCGTPFRPGASFCWNCGTRLREPLPGTPAPPDPESQTTGVIDPPPPADDAQPTAVIAPAGGTPE